MNDPIVTDHTYLSRVTDAIARGSVPVGTVVNLGDPIITEVVASAGADFVWIDLEHSAISHHELTMHILAARANGCAPFVRVPWNDPVRVKPILEMGPAAIVFPFVNSAAEAEAAVAACRYPPHGIRGFCPHRANGYGNEPLEDYLERSQSEPWVVVQIEHIDAVANIEEICAVPGIGSLLVGPFDLSLSAGVPGQMHAPTMIAYFDRIAEVARKANLPFGAFAGSEDEATIGGWLRRGVAWLALDTEYSLISRGMKRAIGTVNRLAEEGRITRR